jgi:hypothetical protein
MVTEMKALYEKFCKIEEFLVQAFLCVLFYFVNIKGWQLIAFVLPWLFVF